MMMGMIEKCLKSRTALQVGRQVMKAAADNIKPVTLESGWKVTDDRVCRYKRR